MGKPKIGNQNYHQGYYILKNNDKYIGNPNNITYRSSWEYRFMLYLDMNESVKKWSSECVMIPYQDLKGHLHRYYPDFYYEIQTSKPEQMDNVVVELKPMKELKQPERPLTESLKELKNYEYSLSMYIKNRLKWNAALDFCQKKGWQFVVITEEHLKKAKIL